MPTELYILLVYYLCVILMLITQSALSVKERKPVDVKLEFHCEMV